MKRRLLEAKGITIPHEDDAGIMCWLAGNYDYSEELVEADALESIEPIANVPADHLHCVPSVYELYVEKKRPPVDTRSTAMAA